jgi:hypothetical protein
MDESPTPADRARAAVARALAKHPEPPTDPPAPAARAARPPRVHPERPSRRAPLPPIKLRRDDADRPTWDELFEWGYKLLEARSPREDETRRRKWHGQAVRKAKRVVRDLPLGGQHVRRKTGELIVHAWYTLPAVAKRRAAVVTAARQLHAALSQEYLNDPKYASDHTAADLLTLFMRQPGVDDAITHLAGPLAQAGRGGVSVAWREFRKNVVGPHQGLPNDDVAGIVAAPCGVGRVTRSS